MSSAYADRTMSGGGERGGGGGGGHRHDRRPRGRLTCGGTTCTGGTHAGSIWGRISEGPSLSQSRSLARRRACQRCHDASAARRGGATVWLACSTANMEFADDCLMPDPETGEAINVSHMIPRSIDDLKRRHRGLRRIAEYSVGIMGRTPDYMNVTFAGFAGERSVWLGPEGRNEEGHDNLVAYQRLIAREDLSLTHTIVHPTIDRVKDQSFAGNPVPLHKVGETSTGIIVRGARILATLAPFADEIAVYPGVPLPAGRPEPVRPELRRADGHARLDLPVPRQRGDRRTRTRSIIRCHRGSTSRTRSPSSTMSRCHTSGSSSTATSTCTTP